MWRGWPRLPRYAGAPLCFPRHALGGVGSASPWDRTAEGTGLQPASHPPLHPRCRHRRLPSLPLPLQKELEASWGVPVFDRFTVVLHVFRCNARTREARLQVALAELPLLRYLAQARCGSVPQTLFWRFRVGLDGHWSVARTECGAGHALPDSWLVRRRVQAACLPGHVPLVGPSPHCGALRPRCDGLGRGEDHLALFSAPRVLVLTRLCGHVPCSRWTGRCFRCCLLRGPLPTAGPT